MLRCFRKPNAPLKYEKVGWLLSLLNEHRHIGRKSSYPVGVVSRTDPVKFDRRQFGSRAVLYSEFHDWYINLDLGL